jgi:hypothetical protein
MSTTSPLTRRHLQFAWWSLLCFLTLGIGLELLHAFKIGWYLETAFETRRLMWTLGHAHGTLLALVHVAFAFTMHVLPETAGRWRRVSSACLMSASILLPGGFFLGGIFLYATDPGIGIYLVPLGAVVLFLGVLLAAWGASSLPEAPAPTASPQPAEKERREAKRARS